MRDTINWDEYFMGIAVMASQRSKDNRSQVGAVIVKNNRVLSTGYNGMSNNVDDKEMPWGAWSVGADNFMENKHFYICHAELNAIINAKTDLTGTTLYTTLYPCNECAKLIIQSGIKEVVYLSEKFNKEYAQFKASEYVLNKAKIKTRKFKSNLKKIELSFEEKDV